MSIFFIDNTEDKEDMIDAIGRYYARDRDSSSMALLLDDFDDALKNVKIDHLEFRGHIQKLVIADHHERAKKLIRVLNDHDIRTWVRVTLRLMFLPFIIPYKIWKWLTR